MKISSLSHSSPELKPAPFRRSLPLRPPVLLAIILVCSLVALGAGVANFLPAVEGKSTRSQGLSVIDESKRLEAKSQAVVTEFPQEDSPPANRNILLPISLGILPFGFLFILVSARLLTGMILDPITRLRRGSEQTEQEDLEHKLPIQRPVEIVPVADSLKDLAIRISESEPHFGLRTETLGKETTGSHSAGNKCLVADEITSRIRAEGEVRRRMAQLEALRQIGLELTGKLDLNELINSIAVSALHLMEADSSGFYLYRPELDVLERVMSAGKWSLPLGVHLRRGEGLSGRVLETGKTLLISDYENWQGRLEPENHLAQGNAIGVPVCWGSEFLGALDVASQDVKFDQGDMELLLLFAHQAGMAIHNAQAMENEARNRRRSDAMLRAAAALASTLNLEELLEKLLREAIGAIPAAERGAVLLFDETSGDLAIHAAVGFQDERIHQVVIPKPKSSLLFEISAGCPVLVPDVHTYPELCGGEISEVEHIQSLILCPMHSRDRIIGFLSLANTSQKGAFVDQDLALLDALAGQTAMAIENARLYQRVRTSEERYALAVRGANDGLWDWDLRSNRVYYSPRWKTMLGYEDAEIEASPEEWFRRIHPEDVGRVRDDIAAQLRGENPNLESEHRMLRKDGSYHWMLARGLAVCAAGEGPHRLAGSLTDIHERKVTEERLRHDAQHDGLTHLPNRVYFIDQLSRAIERTRRRSDYLAAVLFLDLDRFKLINDSLGHEAGDKLLVAIARRLETCLRPGDIVARFGGDEFAILIDQIDYLGDAIQVAERVQRALAAPINLQGHEMSTSASLGIAPISPGYARPEDLLRDADIAMYQAKINGRSRYEVFNATMHTDTLELLELESHLRRGLECEEFEIYYQPVVALSTGEIVGVEALLRWRHPQRGLLSPSEFMGILEETGMVIPVGEWVLRTACTQARHWQNAGYPDLRVGVNLSGRQLSDQELPKIVRLALADSGLAAQSLMIEINESAAMQEVELTIRTLQELKNIGVRTAIDGFGQSYSSLGYLRRFPVDTLKIDQSFVHDLSAGIDNSIMSTAIIAISHAMHLNVVAEGVETLDQLELLLAQCDEVQGRYISPPIPKEEFLRWLRAKQAIFFQSSLMV